MGELIDREMLAKWEARMGLSPTNTFRVAKRYISSSYKHCGPLIGYCAGNNTIYYSRKVDEPTLVHELLHKLHPTASEKRIRELTKETLELFELHGSLT